jgi:phosphate transport system protein
VASQGHTLKAFDEDLDRLRALITEMGGRAEHAIIEAMRCLSERDGDAALKVIEDDKRIDALEVETERRVVQLIALRAPMAGDLRDVVVARIAVGMVHDVLNAFVQRDAEAAVQVCERDKAVDDFYDSIFRTLLTHMMENPHNIGQAAHLLFVAKNLERVGDHATNIAEMVYYAATGQHMTDRIKGAEGLAV